MRSGRFASLMVLTLLLGAGAGCVAFDAGSRQDPVPVGGVPESYFPIRMGDSVYRLRAVAGGVSELRVEGGDGGEVRFGEPLLVVREDGRMEPVPVDVRESRTRPIPLGAGETLRFLPPPGAGMLNVTFDGTTSQFRVHASGGFLRGEHVVELLEVQERDYPHRMPGHENYAKAQRYFADYFRALGYEVEVDPYGTMAFDGVKAPDAARGIGPSSVANVVATKPGTASPPKYIVFGGHYDVVEQTVHGAFDNTGGSMAVLELARAFANVTTEHTLVFGLWGGEEDGILGSRFWVETNKEKIPHVTAAINLDVTGLAWPGPLTPAPDPIMVTAGPDGPVAERMLAAAEAIVREWARFGHAPVLYQPIGVGGQVGGSGVNAQSDHTSFASNGIPAYMFSTGSIDTVFALIHKPTDTLANMTAYMVTGQAPYDAALTPEEEALGRDLLARSYEAQMWLPFYFTVLLDAGLVETGAP